MTNTNLTDKTRSEYGNGDTSTFPLNYDKLSSLLDVFFSCLFDVTFNTTAIYIIPIV